MVDRLEYCAEMGDTAERIMADPSLYSAIIVVVRGPSAPPRRALDFDQMHLLTFLPSSPCPVVCSCPPKPQHARGKLRERPVPRLWCC